MPPKYPLIEILKTGTFTAADGTQHTYTDADLSRMAAQYNSADNVHEAPIVIGHPKTDSPAYGWIGELVHKGTSLFAKPSRMAPAFVEACKNNMYKKVSMSHYPDGLLRHVGFLGGTPPAIKGLEAFCFNDGDKAAIDLPEADYMEWQEADGFVSVGRMFGNLRDWIISKFDLATADNVLPSYAIDNLKQIQPDPVSEPAAGSTFSEGDRMDLTQALAKITALETENATLKTQVADFTEQLKTANGKVVTLETTIATTKTDQEKSAKAARRAEFAEFLKAKCAGRISPKVVDETLDTLESKHLASQSAEYAEGSGKKSPLVEYKEKLESLPTVVEFSEHATKTRAAGESDNSDPVKIAQKIDIYRAEQLKIGKVVSFSEAMEAIRNN